MPRIKSAIKRVEITERNRLRNQSIKSSFRTAIKKVLVNLKADSATQTQMLNKAYSAIDNAVVKGVLHRNTAARYKARVAKAVQKTTVA